jgi:hypothetical protein
LTRVAVILLAVLLPAVSSGIRTSAEQTAGNGFYAVVVEDEQSKSGTGVFAAATGPEHPADDDQSVLFRGDGSDNKHGSYLTVRSWTTGTDYVQTTGAVSSPNLVTRLDSIGATGAIDGGFRTVYDVAAPDRLRVLSDVRVEGTGTESAIVLRAEITNSGDLPAALGLRYLLDFELAGDDGPGFAPGKDADLVTREESYSSLPAFRVESGSVRLFGSTSRVPDEVTFAQWPEASGAAFEYEAGGQDIASAGGTNDSAVLVYFGKAEATAIRLAPGESLAVRITLAHKQVEAAPPPEVPVAPVDPAPAPGQAPPQVPAQFPATGGRM